MATTWMTTVTRRLKRRMAVIWGDAIGCAYKGDKSVALRDASKSLEAALRAKELRRHSGTFELGRRVRSRVEWGGRAERRAGGAQPHMLR